MPVYGTIQPGGGPTALQPGDYTTLFDGTEAAAAGLKSIAFNRATGVTREDNGTSFFVSGAPAGSVVQIQASAADVDGRYFTVGTINPDANGNGAYTDIGRGAFYRAVLSTYVGGIMPVVVAQR